MIEKNGDLLNYFDDDGNGLLHMACNMLTIDNLKILLTFYNETHYHNVFLKNKRLQTPFIFACCNGDYHKIKYFIDTFIILDDNIKLEVFNIICANQDYHSYKSFIDHYDMSNDELVIGLCHLLGHEDFNNFNDYIYYFDICDSKNAYSPEITLKWGKCITQNNTSITHDVYNNFYNIYYALINHIFFDAIDIIKQIELFFQIIDMIIISNGKLLCNDIFMKNNDDVFIKNNDVMLLCDFVTRISLNNIFNHSHFHEKISLLESDEENMHYVKALNHLLVKLFDVHKTNNTYSYINNNAYECNQTEISDFI
jgi:hypothetical protein